MRVHHTTETAFFRLRDVNSAAAEKTGVKCKVDGDAGVGVYIEGYSTNCAADEYEDAVIYLEVQDGKPMLRVWADINSEEPTHTIDLSGSACARRLTKFRGNLYYMDEKGVKNHIADFEETGETAAAMEKKVLDQLWDSRLDSASCSPHFEYEIVV